MVGKKISKPQGGKVTPIQSPAANPQPGQHERKNLPLLGQVTPAVAPVKKK